MEPRPTDVTVLAISLDGCYERLIDVLAQRMSLMPGAKFMDELIMSGSGRRGGPSGLGHQYKLRHRILPQSDDGLMFSRDVAHARVIQRRGPLLRPGDSSGCRRQGRLNTQVSNSALSVHEAAATLVLRISQQPDKSNSNPIEHGALLLGKADRCAANMKNELRDTSPGSPERRLSGLLRRPRDGSPIRRLRRACVGAVLVMGLTGCAGTQTGTQGCGFGGQRCGLLLGGSGGAPTPTRPPETGLYVSLASLAAGVMASGVGGGHLYLGMSRANQAVEPGEPDRDYLLDQSDRNKEVGVLGLSVGVPLIAIGAVVMRYWLSDREEYRKLVAPKIQLGIKRKAAVVLPRSSTFGDATGRAMASAGASKR